MDILDTIKQYEFTDSEKSCLMKSAEAFNCATDKESLEMYYRLCMYACLLDCEANGEQ